jgi:gas vesicle protein
MVKKTYGRFLLGVTFLTLTACSTTTKSTLTGAGVGAAVGGIAGSFLPGAEPQNVIVGAVAGGTLGALSGALIHKSMEDKEREAFEKGKSSKDSNSNRSSTVASGPHSDSKRYVPPRIERRWLDEEIRGNTLIEGHYEQVIVEEGHWE